FGLAAARSLVRGGQTETRPSDPRRQTDFAELGVSFTIADGVASSSDLDVRSPLLRIGGEGRIDLAASRIDYTLRTSVVGTATGQDRKDLDAVRGVTIPVQVAGPLDAPSWRIDWAAAAKEAIASRAAEAIRERLKGDGAEGKASDRLGGVLRELFKR
ncbi:MAG TPA: AsmA-like C-terminal region-containing protein, partial [Burkholderiaceae bacterium]|nr:AsmA-like C-terminal region-containing protein [Burkholderiaceae bacterium]